jgi:hypothetical protein
MTDAQLRQLASRVRRGEYEIDTEAVAEAVLRHWRRDALRVLVAGQPLDGPAVGADEHQSRSLDRLA